MTATVDVAALRGWLADGGEIAFLDVREEGQHGSGHPLLAVNIPYSRLEAEIVRLVPRRSCRVVLVDDADGVAGKAARRLAGLGYHDLHVLEGGAAAWEAAGYRLFPRPTSRARLLPGVAAAESSGSSSGGRTMPISSSCACAGRGKQTSCFAG
jgi:rhodanese-related sulfurtransferase